MPCWSTIIPRPGSRGCSFSGLTRKIRPWWEKGEEGVAVHLTDHVLGRKLVVDADLVALSAGVAATDTEELSTIIKTGRNREGFFIEAHVKLRPVDAATEGVFICGTAHSPKLITETIAQAMAAASRATTYLSQDFLTLSAVTALVDPDHWRLLSYLCAILLPFPCPGSMRRGKSYIDPALCQGVRGMRVRMSCQNIKLNWYEDNQLLSKVEALLEGEI